MSFVSESIQRLVGESWHTTNVSRKAPPSVVSAAVMSYKVQVSAADRKITITAKDALSQPNFTANVMLLRKHEEKKMLHIYPERLSWEGNVCSKKISSQTNFSPSIPSVSLLCLQMAAKMGGDQMPNMNSSSPVLDPSLYGFGGQKRSLDNGGKPSVINIY